MKRVIALALVLALATLVLSSCGGGSAQGVAKDFIKGYEEKDADAINETLCFPWDEWDKDMFDNIDKVSVSDDLEYQERDIDIIEEKEVVAIGEIKIEYDEEGYSDETLIGISFSLQKWNGDWCIYDYNRHYEGEDF